MHRGNEGAKAPAGSAAKSAAANGIDDDATKRTISRQVKGVVVATVMLAGVFLTATAHAVFVIDGASVELDRQRALTAVRIAEGSGTVLNDAAVRWMAQNFDLEAARLIPPHQVKPEQAAVPAGDKMLAWTPRRIGSETFRQIAPLRIGVAMILILAISLVLQRLYTLAKRMDAARLEARDLAGLDPLTGLSNRLDFNSKLDASIGAASGDNRAALLLLDLDGFKQVNDRFGHVAGDRLLQEVAQRLRAHAAATDAVARLGGDEFAIVRGNGLTRTELDEFSRGLVRLISTPCFIDGQSVHVSVSIGIARIDYDTLDSESLIRAADAALYRAKARPGGAYEFAATTKRPAVVAPIEQQAA
jgi:diguanylate cyclase (GGDEF)-like protein